MTAAATLLQAETTADQQATATHHVVELDGVQVSLVCCLDGGEPQGVQHSKSGQESEPIKDCVDVILHHEAVCRRYNSILRSRSAKRKHCALVNGWVDEAVCGGKRMQTAQAAEGSA